jgi:hypothetical protein
VQQARNLLDSVWIAADVPKIWDEMIDTLVKTIAEANVIPDRHRSQQTRAWAGFP